MNKLLIILFVLLLPLGGLNFAEGQNQTDAMRKEALREMKGGRYGEAIDLLNKYIAARPRKPEGYNLRGICYEQRQQYELSVYDFRSAKKLAPKDKEIDANLSKATKTWYTLLYNDIEGYKREIAINPKDADNYLAVGKDYKNLGQWPVAEHWYDKYLTMTHASPDEIIRYSEILAKTNHIAKGWPVLRRYTREYPSDQRLWSRYGYFSMWLGKYGTAVKAFRNSLAIKPFFKEAMDGLDLARGKGYIYTINDTTSRHFYFGMRRSVPRYVYPIDRYYRIVKAHPKNFETRIKLIKSLMKAGRFEEASQQSQMLSNTGYDSLKAEAVISMVDSLSTIYYKKKIGEDIKKLAADSLDQNTVLDLGANYVKLQDYDSAIAVYTKFLKACPGINSVIYSLAEAEAKNRDFFKARDQVGILLKKDPHNLKYQLFAAQLDTWIGQNFDEARNFFNNVLQKQPDNLSALVGLSSLSMQQNNFVAAESLMGRIKKLYPYSQDIKALQNALVLNKFRYEQGQNYAVLQKAEKLYGEGKCKEALPLYEKFLKNSEGNTIIEKEYGDVNVCAGNYKKAIEIYSDLLEKGYDYNVDYARANAYMAMGDSVNALKSFQSLAKKNPDDFNANLYLGDAYFAMHEYGKAKQTYDSMKVNMKLDSSQTVMLNSRYGWLPQEYSGAFPTYAMITPYGSYYSDNLGIRNNVEGLRLDLGLTGFLTFAVEGFRSNLSTDTTRLNSKSFRLALIFRLLNNLSLGLDYGQTYYGANLKRPLAGAFLRYESGGRYSLYGTYTRSDASQILYSPNLVGLRINSNMFRFGGYYRTESGVKFSTDAGYFGFSDGNKGYNLSVRLGYYFFQNFIMGYEFYNSGWEKTTSLYYSPASFTSHNLFADWEIVNKSSLNFTVGGLIGLIENSSAILRQAYASASWRVLSRLTIQARVSGGGSFQNVIGYSSFGASLSAYWNL